MFTETEFFEYPHRTTSVHWSKESEQFATGEVLHSMLMEGARVIEWPERLGDLIPKERLWINLDHMAEEHRQMRFNANGKRYDDLLDDIRQSMFGGA